MRTTLNSDEDDCFCFDAHTRGRRIQQKVYNHVTSEPPGGESESLRTHRQGIVTFGHPAASLSARKTHPHPDACDVQFGAHTKIEEILPGWFGVLSG